MNNNDRAFEGACARLYIEFFEEFPNGDLRDRASRALAMQAIILETSIAQADWRAIATAA